ncbi:hypothetical protein SELMODRAFT_407213 [Selaginella moellendorffii]|uniref:Vesicle-fusing ATPase n=1 Tax=Selaginella moellendorffii TaxID=88036 RepID=D8R4A1_SELML|nr:hypothetical protein SELMODRAFT_407213 [Selaginella moellendorffii]
MAGHSLAQTCIQEGQIALNAIQRRNAKVSSGDEISVAKFLAPDKGFKLVVVNLELEFVKAKGKSEQLDAQTLGQELQRRFVSQVFTVGQKATFEYCGINYVFNVSHTLVEGQKENDTNVIRGMLSPETAFLFETNPGSGIKKLGIGGLDLQFQDIFRRAFASRVFPPHVVSRLGISHVKGLLLFGPPGTGKTLIARQIGKMLNGREPKVVNGPEVLSKFVGETEKNIRDLFSDAENDKECMVTIASFILLYLMNLMQYASFCFWQARGTTRDSTGVHDGIVNQLLTKIPGVDSLNNILLIGMTNRKDLLDEALLRPGRLEVQIEIGLPDEKGRLQILRIHSTQMKEHSFLASDVNLEELATRTKNFSGAELEGLVKSAVSFGLNRQVNVEDLSQPIDEENIKVTMNDFLQALHEVKPAFGAAINTLEMYRTNGMMNCGDRHRHIRETAMTLVEQVKSSERTSLLTFLLEGPSGSGKTALASTVAIDSDFPYMKIVTCENMVGLTEATKCGLITKVFEDAYKSPLSIIILDEIESMVHVLQSMDLVGAFNVTLNAPNLEPNDVKKVLQEIRVFAPQDIDTAVRALDQEIPIKRLLMLVEMAAQGKGGEGAADVYAGKKKIDINHFFECLHDLA